MRKVDMMLAYSDDVDFIGRTIREATSKIKKESANMGLAMNEDKTYIMVSASKASTRLDQSVNVDNRYNFEVVDESYMS